MSGGGGEGGSSSATVTTVVACTWGGEGGKQIYARMDSDSGLAPKYAKTKRAQGAWHRSQRVTRAWWSHDGAMRGKT